MKILDIRRKGNAFRLYLGKDTLKDWYGDDWDDIDATDIVYDEFISAKVDISLPYIDQVVSPFDFYENENRLSKDKMKSKLSILFAICFDVNAKEEWEDIYSENRLASWEDKLIVFMSDDYDDFIKKLKERRKDNIIIQEKNIKGMM